MNDDDELEAPPPWVARFFLGDGDDLVNAWEVRAGASDANARTTLFIASTPAEDRALDVVRQDWRLANYRSNPIILDNHYGGRVVGRGEKSSVPADTKNLEILVRWDLENPDPLVRSVGHQHLSGFRSAGSVGFRSGAITRRDKLPTDHEAYRTPAKMATPWGEYEWAGLLYEKNELLEFSSASIPMNPGALHRPSRDGSGKALELSEHLATLDDPLLKAITVARETTPRHTSDELVELVKRDQAALRKVVGWFESRPADPPAPPPARRALLGDGLDFLFPSGATP